MQPDSAFVLHVRPYKETSALLDLFSREQGRIRAVLRGYRSKKGSVARPFNRLEVEFAGRGELKSLARLEPSGGFLLLEGQRLMCALYLNELSMRLLPQADPLPLVFEHYELTLQALAAGQAVEPLLRSYEWRLLEQLGYAFALEHDCQGQALDPARWYQLQPELGLVAGDRFQPGAFLGADLQALAEVQWHQPNVLLAAKRLMRQALAPHLGSRPLMSRGLFLRHKETSA
ncbi:MAG: DNA repair protein RecO [Thiopseudomonas sp.]|nr:DNA repair protein RecO [Thiopseudomonas sp.]